MFTGNAEGFFGVSSGIHGLAASCSRPRTMEAVCEMRKKPHLRIIECCAVSEVTFLEVSGDGDAGLWLRWLGVAEWYRRILTAVDVWWLRWSAAIVDGWWLRWMVETGWYRRLMTRDVWRLRETMETRWFQEWLRVSEDSVNISLSQISKLKDWDAHLLC